MSRCQQPRKEKLETKDEAGKRGKKTPRHGESTILYQNSRESKGQLVPTFLGAVPRWELCLFFSPTVNGRHTQPPAMPRQNVWARWAVQKTAGLAIRLGQKFPAPGQGGRQGPAGRECPAAWHPWLLWGSLGELTPAGMKDIWGFQQAGQCSPSSCAPWNPSRVGTIRRASYKPTQPSPAQP